MAARACRGCPDEEISGDRQVDSDGRTRFHYSREEREGLRRRPLPDHSGRHILRGNRSLIILLIDVVIVLLLGGIYFTFLRGDPASTTIDGYEFTLSARSFEEESLLTLAVTNRRGSAPPGEPFRMELLNPEPALLAAQTEVPESELSSDLQRLLRGELLYDLLPETDTPRRLRLLLPLTLPRETEITVRVGWGDRSEELTTVLLHPEG